MSAAIDEAEDGPDLNSDDDAGEEKVSEVEGSDQSQEDETPTPRRGSANGDREQGLVNVDYEDSQGVTEELQGLKSEESSLVRISCPENGRPSSADGSLSIPDDTPSLQVSKSFVSEAGALIDVSRALCYHRLQEERHCCLAMDGVQHRLCDLFIDVSKPARLPHLLIHHARPRRRFSNNILAKPPQPLLFRKSRKMRKQRRLGRLYGGPSLGK